MTLEHGATSPIVAAIEDIECGAQVVVVFGSAGAVQMAVRAVEQTLPDATVLSACGTYESDSGELVRCLLRDVPDSLGLRARREASTERVLAELAQGPVVLVVEHADRVDPESLCWIDHLLRRARRRPLLVVLSRCGRVRPRAPGPLAQLSARSRRQPAELAPCGGVEGGHHRPDTVAGLEPDDPIARAVACAVAVLGSAPADLVAAVVGVSTPHCLEVIARLPEVDQVASVATLRFREDARRDEVLASLEPRKLIALRRRAALRLSDAGHPVDVIAAQLLDTPPSRESWARQIVRMAATIRIADQGLATAAAHLKWLGTAERDDQRYTARPVRLSAATARADNEVNIELAQAWAQVDPELAAQQLAVLLADPVAIDPSARVAIAIELAQAFSMTERPAEGLAVLLAERDRWERASQWIDPELAGVIAITLRFLMAMRGSTPMRSQRLNAGCPVGVTAAGRRALAMHALLSCLFTEGPPELVAPLARRTLVLGAELPMTRVLAAMALHLCGASEQAGEAFERLSPTLTSHVDHLAVCHRALWRIEVGGIPGALCDARQAHALAQEVGRSAGGQLTAAVLASALLAAGDYSAASRTLGFGDDHTACPPPEPADSDRWWEYLVLLDVWARLLLRLRRADEAATLLAGCVATASEIGIRNPLVPLSWRDYALLLHARGEVAAARGVLAAASDQARVWPTPRAGALIGVVDGVLEGGRPGLAKVAASVEVFDRCDAPLEAARARIHLGILLTDAGHNRDARGHLRQAIQTAVRCGARGLARAGHARLVLVGGRMRMPSDDCAAGLTESERRVVQMAARGLANRAIADELVVTLRTVESHLTHAYRKLGVRRRSELAGAIKPRRSADGGDGRPC